MSTEQITEIVSQLGKSNRLLIITGAGISADSGLPTYRGLGGLYENSATEDNVSVEEAISAKMLKWRPELCWKYLLQIESACRQAGWNRGHQVIFEMERYFRDVMVLTQNIDGFHISAGSEQVVEVHGNLNSVHCIICDYNRETSNWKNLKLPPECPRCGGLMRPNVVLFGENLPENALRRVSDFVQQKVDVCFSIGTSSLFEYIAWPFIQASVKGGFTIEINPGDTPVSEYASITIRDKSATSLDQIWDRFLGA
jgi:NAD-dependent deacetylase